MKNLKKIILSTIAIAITNIAAAKNPTIFTYYAGWSNQPIPDLKYTATLPSFAEMKQNSAGLYTDYTKSGNFQQWGTYAYDQTNKWAQKYADYVNDSGKLYVAYGGSNNTDFYRMVINSNDEQLSNIAGEIKANVKKYYFTGVDLDIEGWWEYGATDNAKFAINLAKMVKALRKSLDSDNQTVGAKIIIAVAANSAGRIPGWFNVPSSDGYMLSFYQDIEAMASIQHVNIMAYNMGVSNFYSNSTLVNSLINTYKSAVGPNNYSKLVFGFQPVETSGQPITPPSTIESLARNVILPSGIGGMFMWGIGTNEMGTGKPADYIKAMKAGLGYVD